MNSNNALVLIMLYLMFLMFHLETSILLKWMKIIKHTSVENAVRFLTIVEIVGVMKGNVVMMALKKLQYCLLFHVEKNGLMKCFKEGEYGTA